MSKFTTLGLNDLQLDFEKIAELPDEVLDDMLMGQAEIVQKAQKRTASTMLRGPYYEGAVAESVTIGKPKRAVDGKVVYISFKGEQHGTKLSEIAFINEYGKTKQPARPFIRTANEQSNSETIEAARRKYDEWLKKNNL